LPERSRVLASAFGAVVGGRREIGLAARGEDHLLTVLGHIAQVFPPARNALMRDLRFGFCIVAR
jgi:hypothetical protein